MTSVITTASQTIAAVQGSQFINGQWREGSSERTATNINPSTGAEIATLSCATTAEVDEAYRAAQSAQPAWAALTPGERSAIVNKAAAIMEERAAEIEAVLRVESGSSALKAHIETVNSIGMIRESASFPFRVHGLIQPSVFPGKENRTYREPLGVVGVISPWNFPLILSTRSVAPALAVGNAVVLKPASDTPYSGALLLAEIFEQAGVPAGVFSVVTGAGSEIGDYFVEHPVPSMISFTGSTPVGQRVGALAASGPRLKRVALELGGNAPVVVLHDADLDAAVDGAIASKFLHQGQICMAANRLIVDASVYEEFCEKFVARAAALPWGDTTEDSTIVGPVVNQQQIDTITGLIESAKAQGATPALVGEISGFNIAPTVFTDVTPDMRIFREEIFGPIIGICKANDEAHALELANDTEFGLSSAVYSRDIERAVQFARGIKAGMTHINDITVNDEPHVMFGGEKNSGIGRFNGEYAIEDFTTTHWIGVRSQPAPALF